MMGAIVKVIVIEVVVMMIRSDFGGIVNVADVIMTRKRRMTTINVIVAVNAVRIVVIVILMVYAIGIIVIGTDITLTITPTTTALTHSITTTNTITRLTHPLHMMIPKLIFRMISLTPLPPPFAIIPPCIIIPASTTPPAY